MLKQTTELWQVVTYGTLSVHRYSGKGSQMRLISKDAWLREITKVDWLKEFSGHIHVVEANPDVEALLLLEAGLRQVEDQLIRSGRGDRDSFGLGKISREDVLVQALALRSNWFPEAPWTKINAKGKFDWRWKSVHEYHACLVIYCTRAPRWTKLLDELARQALRGLQKVATNARRLFDLVEEIALADIRLRERMVKPYIFLLSLTMDSDWKAVASHAYREFSKGQTERWTPVYETGVALLGVKYRPGWTSAKLNALISALAASLAIEAACSGDESCKYDENNKLLLAEGIKALFYRAVDPGGRPDLFDE